MAALLYPWWSAQNRHQSIEWFLKENRAELLSRGYFVPESGNIHGGHHAIVKKLCGQVVPDRQELVVAEFVRALAQTRCRQSLFLQKPCMFDITLNGFASRGLSHNCRADSINNE
jgi:hypothetical protein